jgi:predicted transglutaminase-like cysteine proteinase
VFLTQGKRLSYRLRAFVVGLAMAWPLALICNAAPASAETASGARWNLPAPSMGKATAVLGRPSQLNQILVQQGSIISPAVPPAAVEREGSLTRGFLPTAVANGTPNVFGSVAVAIAATPLDDQWRRASGSALPASALRWAASIPIANAADRSALIERANSWVNNRIEFTDDTDMHGRADRWSAAEETFRRGRGDCEDYALAKMQLLRALGFAEDEMYLVIVHDLVRRADHAVLVVELNGRHLVLDNMTDAIVDARAVSDYRPIMSFSGDRRWIHGYAYQPDPIQLAALRSDTAP